MMKPIFALVLCGLLTAPAFAGDRYYYESHDHLGLRAPLSEVAHAVVWPVTTVERNGIIGGAVRIVTGPELQVGSPSDGMSGFHSQAQARAAEATEAEIAKNREPVRVGAEEKCAYGVCWKAE